MWVDLLANDSLDAWQPYDSKGTKNNWHLADGVLHLKAESGDLITREQYADFELKWDWKISENGNSGVLYRVRTGDKKAWHSAPEYQLIDNLLITADKKPSQATGALYDLVPPLRVKVNPAGEWNASRIRWKRNTLEHWLNEKRVVVIDTSSAKWRSLVKASKFAKYKQFAAGRKGHLCLQDHRTEVWFRNMRIRRLN